MRSEVWCSIFNLEFWNKKTIFNVLPTLSFMQYGSGDPFYFGPWSEFIASLMFFAACVNHAFARGCAPSEAELPTVPFLRRTSPRGGSAMQRNNRNHVIRILTQRNAPFVAPRVRPTLRAWQSLRLVHPARNQTQSQKITPFQDSGIS
jgi:hypothetical protein